MFFYLIPVFLHIFPTVLEVSVFPCGRTPFQLAEDIDAQLSGVPRSSCNDILTSDSSQNQRDGNRRVPDQDCTEDEGELPIPFSQFFPMSNERCEDEHYCAAG